jgi:hypothetical protein
MGPVLSSGSPNTGSSPVIRVLYGGSDLEKKEIRGLLGRIRSR